MHWSTIVLLSVSYIYILEENYRARKHMDYPAYKELLLHTTAKGEKGAHTSLVFVDEQAPKQKGSHHLQLAHLI
jgi:hypothetical protein